MNTSLVKKAVKLNRIVWNQHAFERMMERGILRQDVKNTIINGEVIEKYENDKPFPSLLFLGWQNNIPLHTVISYDENADTCFIITVYYPDLNHFEPDYKTRKIRK